MRFDATLNVTLTQTAGPTITNPQHIADWLAVGWTGINLDRFAICSEHDDPDNCDDTSCDALPAVWSIEIHAVAGIEPTPNRYR